MPIKVGVVAIEPVASTLRRAVMGFAHKDAVWAVSIFPSADAAIRQVPAVALDAYVMAVQSADQYASESLTQLRSFARESPIVVVSRSDDKSLCERVLADGADDCIPATKEALGRLGSWLHQAIALRRAEADVHRLRSELEAKIAERTKQLAHVEQLTAVGQLAGGIAHDFNNILTGILGFANVIFKSLGPDDPRRAELGELVKLAERAGDLSRQLLVYARRKKSPAVRTNLNAVLTLSQGMLQSLCKGDVSLEFDLADDLGLVLADAGQIEQVLVNLTLNAHDATPPGGRITVKTYNERLSRERAEVLRGLHSDDAVVLEIADTGKGMPPEVLSRIFEPFFTTKDPKKGTGLGLPMVQSIAKESRAAVSVESAVGKGTTVRIHFPRVYGAPDAGPAVSQGPAPSVGHETILIVEDEKVVRDLALRILQAAGYNALSAGNAEETFQLSDDAVRAIDLVVSDVVMPGLNGPQTAERLRDRCPSLRVLFMSGYPEAILIDRGFLKPGTPILQKPFSPDDLIHRIRTLLDVRAS